MDENKQVKVKRKGEMVFSNEDDLTHELLKQQSEFNQLIEKALDIDVDKRFDVKKYLPKNNEQYSSKILRKYQGVLNKKESGAQQGIMMTMNQNSNENDVSEIKNEYLIDNHNETTFNYNFMPTHNNKKDNAIDEDIRNKNANDYCVEYNEPYFSVYIEEIDEKSNDVNNDKKHKRKDMRNDIEILNNNITKSYINNNHGLYWKNDKDNYMWYCLDYNCEENDKDRLEIEEQFMNYE